MDYSSINLRYSQLAKTECCLSCGGALNFSKVQPGEICVDLGSGRGTDVLRMAEQAGEEGFAYGIDISDGMLATARENAAKFGVGNVKFIQSELEKLELADQTADLVVSNCTINHAADKAAVWNEIFRILKKGGRFVVSDIYATSPVPEEYRNDPVAVSECWAGSVTREEYLDTLNAVGFQKITILEESKPYPKGKVEVCSFTIAGERPKGSTCGCKA
ncbi:MAG: methyltransferase domain-containing protein [Prolixibacteraceae bacterium]|jgi:ubiquinone/menaquinone biosynthesis C-methylase UbiE|nr:methyltransferase domain-containing protein [Prolixibacteraceae bacterium]